MPWFFFYWWAFFHPVQMQPQPQFYNKGIVTPPAIVQPLPPQQDFSCRVVKYPTKGDPTMITLCPEHDVRVD